MMPIQRGRDKEFEMLCNEAGIVIFGHCGCGSMFCQHDLSVRDASWIYDSSTQEAWRMYALMKKES